MYPRCARVLTAAHHLYSRQEASCALYAHLHTPRKWIMWLSWNSNCLTSKRPNVPWKIHVTGYSLSLETIVGNRRLDNFWLLLSQVIVNGLCSWEDHFSQMSNFLTMMFSARKKPLSCSELYILLKNKIQSEGFGETFLC